MKYQFREYTENSLSNSISLALEGRGKLSIGYCGIPKKKLRV